MKQLKFILEQVVTDVTQSSRSEALLFFQTEQVRQLRFLFLLRETSLQKLRQQVLIMLEEKSSFLRFRTTDGLTLT